MHRGCDGVDLARRGLTAAVAGLAAKRPCGISAAMSHERREQLVASAYPEVRFGGFTRVDGLIAFYSRVQALVQPDSIALDVGCGRGSQADDPSPYRQQLR